MFSGKFHNKGKSRLENCKRLMKWKIYNLLLTRHSQTTNITIQKCHSLLLFNEHTYKTLKKAKKLQPPRSALQTLP